MLVQKFESIVRSDTESVHYQTKLPDTLYASLDEKRNDFQDIHKSSSSTMTKYHLYLLLAFYISTSLLESATASPQYIHTVFNTFCPFGEVFDRNRQECVGFVPGLTSAKDMTALANEKLRFAKITTCLVISYLLYRY